MPPKQKKNKSEPAPTELDIRLPSVDPVVAARHQQVEKWIQRLQEVSRDASHARRQRGLLLRKLGELEEALQTTNTAASDAAFAPLRPPPPIAAPAAPSPRQRSKSIVKLKGSATATASDLDLAPLWKAPEPAEVRKLTRMGNEMMHYYHAPKDGFPANAVKEKKGNMTRSLYKSQSKVVSSPTAPSTSKTPPLSASIALGAGSMSIQNHPGDPPNAANGNKAGGKTPRGSEKQQKTPRGGGGGANKGSGGESTKDGGTLSRKVSIVMASMSLAGGVAAAPTPAIHPDEDLSHKKGNKKNQHKRDMSKGASSAPPTTTSASAAAAVRSGVFDGDELGSFRVGRRSSRTFMSAGASCSMNGSMFAEILIPYSAALDRPPAISPANWDTILRLRATRIDTSERIDEIQASLIKAQARVGVVKERERIAAYSLLAAHRSLVATGSSRDLVGVLPPGISEKISAALAEPSELTTQTIQLQQSVTLCADTTDTQLPPISSAGLKAQRSAVLQ